MNIDGMSKAELLSLRDSISSDIEMYDINQYAFKILINSA